MTHTGEVEARMAPNRLFEYILKKYFYHPLPIPTQTYLSVLKEKPVSVRLEVARHCHHPEIIEALVEDESYEVAREATRNEYWRLLGQFRGLLNLSRQEKIEFIRREGFPNILIFVVFETDLKVLEELYQHPSLSVHMLNSLRNHLSRIQTEIEVQDRLQMLQAAIARRRRRIFQVTGVFKAAKSDNPHQSIRRILPYLLDDDEVVVKSAVNVLKHYDYNTLRTFIFQENPFEEEEPDTVKIWLLLRKLQEYYRLSGQPMLQLNNSPLEISHTQETFQEDIYFRKVKLLDYCANNMTDTQNLTTLAYAYLDPDPRIQNKLSGILNMEEFMSLLNDPTFPQAVSYQIIKILKNHPSAYVQKRLSEIFLEISERTRRRLREMELTINAYFDIIFNLLGYPRINQIRQAFKILEAARKLTDSFITQNNESTEEFDKVFILFTKIAGFYQKKLAKLYLEMTANRVKELEEVYEIILIILNIPQDFVKQEGYLKEEDPRQYYKILNRTRTIWRSALGQYLGRLRELDEMIRRRWLFITTQSEQKQVLKEEFKKVLEDLETGYKEEMKCKLRMSCSACQKRPCASERYLRQVEFFLGELLDYLASESGKKNRVRLVATPEMLSKAS